VLAIGSLAQARPGPAIRWPSSSSGVNPCVDAYLIWWMRGL
jgi:hypothetical protein